jgi:hypothetical protein
MTLREKVIVVLTGVAVVWAGVSFLQGRRSGTGSGHRTEELPVSDVKSVAVQCRAQLTTARLTAGARSVLDAAGSEWNGAFFGGDAGTVRVKDADEPPAYVYSGFVQVGASCFAVVNGREYRLNDMLEDGNRVVDSIAPGQVVLKSVHEGGRPLVIQFQNPGLTKE